MVCWGGDDDYFSTVKETMPSRVMKNEALSSLEKNYPFPSSIAKGCFLCQFNEGMNLGLIAYRNKRS